MTNRVFVVGVGMTKFERVGKRPNWHYPEIAKEAIKEAIADCGLEVKDLQAVVASYCYGESCCGQRVFREVGLTGVPVFNVNSNCSSGSSALFLARKLVLSGNECVLTVGFEEMERGLSLKYKDHLLPLEPHLKAHDQLIQSHNLNPVKTSPKLNMMTSGAMTLFTSAGLEHIRKYDTDRKAFSMIAYKNHVHSTFNKKACFQGEVPLEMIEDEKMRLTDLIFPAMAGPTANGGAAAILVSEQFLNKHPQLRSKAVEILSQELMSDSQNYSQSFSNIIGIDLARVAAKRVLKTANLSIQDVQVIELHDCFAPNELLLYEALGLCPPGKAGNLILDQLKWINTANGGRLARLADKYIVNPSGGLESKGHPLGATGLAQCYELCLQLRHQVEKERQVPNAKVALQHNTGIGSCCVVTLYRKYQPVELDSKI